MESLGIVLFLLLFAAVPLLFLVVGIELLRVARLVRREQPELYHRFGGYGGYPSSTRHNLLLFVLGKRRYEEPKNEILTQRCRRIRLLSLVLVGTLFGGAGLAMALGS